MKRLHPFGFAALLVLALTLGVVSSLAFSATGVQAVRGASVPAVDLPRSALTPGAVFPVGKARVCTSGYAGSVRNVPESEKAAVYARYHVRHVPYAHEVDHLVSLELGGSNAIRNLWPEPYAGKWGARTKDRLENRLHSMVCGGSIPLRTAQRWIAHNWPVAYTRIFGAAGGGAGSGGGSNTSSTTATTVVTVTATTATTATTTTTTTTTTETTTGPGDPYDPGGFYASSYPTASTIYCADDPGWKSLSPKYLQHFGTWAEAIAAHPTYHLHQPC